MEADATNAKLKFDTAAQPTAELTRNIERCAGEYMLKARIVVSGIADESRYRQAVKLMSTAIDLVSGRLPEETLAEYLFDYAVLLTDVGQQTKALETWERLSGIYERLYRKAPQKYAYGYAGVLNNMAVLYSDKGDFDHCLSKYLKAVDIYDRLDREGPGIYDDDIARLKNNLGTLYSDRDEYNKALSEFNEAARIRFELLAKDNDPDSRSALADIYCNMATALQFSDHPQEALRYIAQAHAILDELDKEFPRIYEYKLYSILNREGSIYTRLDQLDKAEESLQKSLQLAANLASRMPLAHSADLATAKMEMSGLNYVLGKTKRQGRDSAKHWTYSDDCKRKNRFTTIKSPPFSKTWVSSAATRRNTTTRKSSSKRHWIFAKGSTPKPHTPSPPTTPKSAGTSEICWSIWEKTTGPARCSRKRQRYIQMPPKKADI